MRVALKPFVIVATNTRSGIPTVWGHWTVWDEAQDWAKKNLVDFDWHVVRIIVD